MILFVGDKPSRFNTDPNVAFKGARCETRLLIWLTRLNPDDGPYVLLNRTDDDFNELIALALANQDPIVAIGKAASIALQGIPHFKLPHPSGRNRQINDKAFITIKLEECKIFLQKY